MFVVRVVLPRGKWNDVSVRTSPDTMLWLEQFNHAGIIKIHRDDDDGVCFDINPPASCPKGRSATWAQMESDRMQSFGINAVKAPEWKGEAAKAL